MNDEFDKELRAALIKAAQLDFEQTLDNAGNNDVSFTSDHILRMSELTKNPFKNKRRKPIMTIAKIARLAACFGVLFVFAVVFIILPYVKTGSFNKGDFYDGDTIDVGARLSPEDYWHPTYIPDGFYEKDSLEAECAKCIYYENTDLKSYIAFFHFNTNVNIHLTIDDIYYTISKVDISNGSGVLYKALNPLEPNYILWSVCNRGDEFLLESNIDTDELILIAEGVCMASE